LEEILLRKIISINKYKKNKNEYEKYLFQCVSTIYGIDILIDNVNECQHRILKIVENDYNGKYKDTNSNPFFDSIKFVIKQNIVHGDALSMERSDRSPILFSEWIFINDYFVKRRVFSYKIINEESSDYCARPEKDFPVVYYNEVHNV